MPRYPEWFKKVGDTAAHPKALDVGKKLLGYLAIRRETPGVQTLVQRVTLDDGTTVEASFAGDQPQVIVYSPDGKDACELYVESGMLDLGPNIAGDADKRFNRGPPQFDDKPATLYFGDGVDCKQGEAGLNGKVRVNPRTKTLASECLPKQGKSMQSRLRDPKKKQAQAMLPASCWSGLMRRYVQAVYGGDQLDYSVSSDVLLVEGMQVGGIGMSVGLVNLDGSLRFVYAGSGPVYTAKVRFKTKCGEAVYRMWKQVRDRAPAAEADKILTIALSEAYPDDALTQIGDTGDLRFVSSYGWQFDTNTPEAYAVTANDSHATVKKLAFTSGEDGLSATVSDFETAELPPLMISCGVSSPNAPTTRMFADDSESRGGAARGSKYEHPIACYFDDGLVVVYYVHDNSLGNDVVVVDGTECGSGYSPEERSNVTLPGDGYNYRFFTAEAQGIFFPADHYTNFGYQHVGSAITGIYAKRNGTVLWSTVEATPVLYLRTISDLSPHTEYVGGAWNFTSTFYEYLPAGSLTESGSNVDGSPPGPDLSEYSGENHLAEFASGDPLCGRKTPTTFTNCGEGSAPHFTEECNLGEDRRVEASWSINRPIAAYTQRTVDVKIIAGATHEIALPRGNCSFVTCARVNRKGCSPQLDMSGDARFNPSHSVLTQIHYIGGHVLFGTPYGDCFGTGSVSHEMTLFCDNVPKETVSFSGGTSDTSAVCTTCWVDGQPWTGQSQMATFMRTDTRILLNGASESERKGGLKKFGSAFSTHYDGVEWSYSPSAPFEFLVDSDHGVFVRDHVTSDFVDEPTKVEDGEGDSSIEEWALNLDAPFILHRDFEYTARHSLLGATTAWVDPFTFGLSVNMDRETITGGYPTVATPSFVGWA